MTYKEFIKQHATAVDYYHNVTVPFLSISNAHKACELAEYELAKELLKLHESARIEVLEKIVYNFENKSTHEQERTQSEQKA